MKKIKARISFPNLTQDKLNHIHNAESELKLAGIEFDTGYDFQERRRDWEFDTVENAEVFLIAPPQGK